MTRAALLASIALAAACRDEARPSSAAAPDPPVSAPESIPDAPVSGTLRGAPFVARDARFVVDRRPGYAHTDLKLSAGKADAPCGPIEPRDAPSVWLRLDGPGTIERADVRLSPGERGPWSVHYQVNDGERWLGVGEGNALVSLRAPSADGRLQGGIAVCFADDARSCVSGSFDAKSCPPRIDEPVRGALPAEPYEENKP